MINLTLPEFIYYGKDEVNKKEFTKLYKKLKLKWSENTILNGQEVSGWFNFDKTEYIIKHQEINHYKRLSFIGCQSTVEFFKGLGAVEFEMDITKEIHKPKEERKMFLGADLDGHYRVEEMLKDMPDYWGVKWK